MNRDINDLEDMIQGDHDVESLTSEIEGYIDIEREIAIESCINVLTKEYNLDISTEEKVELLKLTLNKIEPDEFN